MICSLSIYSIWVCEIIQSMEKMTHTSGHKPFNNESPLPYSSMAIDSNMTVKRKGRIRGYKGEREEERDYNMLLSHPSSF